MKLNLLMRERKESKKHARFYTSRDMAELKHYEAITNAQAKRGERKQHEGISVCGCGVEGCFMFWSRNS